MNIPQAAWLKLVLVIMLVGGCAAAPRVEVAEDPQAEFERYATFGFHSPLGTDRQDGTRTILSQTLQRVARAELESRGYRYVEQDGDLEVNFFVDTREVIEGLGRPGVGIGIGYGIYHGRYRVWTGYDTDRVRQYTEGTLHVDVIDARRNQLVWEAIARDRLGRGDFVFEPDEVERAVQLVFARFPRRVAALD